jgi:uncharacterized protein
MRVAGRGGAPLAARELPALFERVHAALAARRELIDDLNVFPVPDGDTGTNMTLTVRSGLDALTASRPPDAAEAARRVIRGSVRGARGNSGVILSQVVRAVVEVVTGHREVSADLYAQALTRARDLAYDAVAEPVEGTILTAIGASAAAARAAADAGASLVETSAAVCEATAAAVERTRDQLEVLRDAGVVDAGARGFEIVLSAVHGHLTGEEPPVRVDRPPVLEHQVAGGCRADAGHPFEVQYLLDADDAVAPLLRDGLERIGDSVVVVAAGGLLNVHVHTALVGPAVELGLEHGRPSEIEVVHFGDQIAAREAARAREGPAALPTVGVVAVLHGRGVIALARREGVVVVTGTSGSLPSVADLLGGIERADGEQVVVLPGHRNAVPTAHKAAELAMVEDDRRVRVVEVATSPPAVMAAIAVIDRNADPDDVVADATAAAGEVRAGQVVAAVRDADTPIGSVRRGQPLAVRSGEVLAATADALEALEQLLGHLRAADAEVLTLLVGADVDADERAAAVELMRTTGEAELEVIDAGQRPAWFWVGAE